MLRNLHLVLTSALVLMVLHDNALSDHTLLSIFLVHFDFLHLYSFLFLFFICHSIFFFSGIICVGGDGIINEVNRLAPCFSLVFK